MNTEDADIIIVAFGSLARVCIDTMKIARKNNKKVGFIRPITLWPFPEKAFEKYEKTNTKFFVAELNAGQMLNDVKIAINDKNRIKFYGKLGGITPTPVELYQKLCEVYQ